MQVRVLKLVSGEEVLGELSEFEFEGKSVLRMRHPVSLLYKTNEEGTLVSVGMAPFALSSKDHIIPIFPSQVISIYDPTDALVKRWAMKFGGPNSGMTTYEVGEEPQVPEYLAETYGDDELRCTNIDVISEE